MSVASMVVCAPSWLFLVSRPAKGGEQYLSLVPLGIHE